MARDYVATARVLALPEEPGCVVEWSARFSCDAAEEAAVVARLTEVLRSVIADLDASLAANACP